MENEEDENLIDKLFDRSLNPAEKRELSDRILREDQLVEDIRFRGALENGFRQKRKAAIIARARNSERLAKRKRRKQWLLAGLAIAIVVALLAWAFWPRYRSVLDETERMELMENVIATGIEEGVLGPIAGLGTNWATKLGAAVRTPANIEAAYADLSIRRQEINGCDNVTASYYAATIALYYYENYEEAAHYLNCVLAYDGPEYKAKAQLPLAIVALAGGRETEAKDYLEVTDFPLEKWPVSLQELYQK